LISEVIEEIGVSRVVQVVSDNGANFKKAGGLIMEKYEQIYWTPCAAHCIDLMLEDIGKDRKIADIVKKAQNLTKFIYNHGWALSAMREATGDRELLRPGITRFATQFLTLQSICNFKDALQRMCLGEKWTASARRLNLRKDIDNANAIHELLLDREFWISIEETILLIEPLVKVLRLVDSDDKPQMGYLYEALDRAKEAIKRNCRQDYKKWWKIIDHRWDNQLHRDIHAAGMFLINLLK
jgi:hypothetical protein